MAPSHLSPQAHTRLTEELAHRTGQGRRDLADWIERAREHGDLKENADYHAAKNEQGLSEARVRQLEAILGDAIIVEAAVSVDIVEAGVVIDIQMGDEEIITYLVGSIEERHAEFDVLSIASPLGKTLIGRARGEVVSYETPGSVVAPGRVLDVTIVDVRPLS